MYKEGKSIDEIAKERGFTKQTIEHHLLANFENGLDIDLEKNINMKYKSQVFKAIDEIGYDKLRPIKDMVSADVTYLDIGYPDYNFYSINKFDEILKVQYESDYQNYKQQLDLYEWDKNKRKNTRKNKKGKVDDNKGDEDNNVYFFLFNGLCF